MHKKRNCLIFFIVMLCLLGGIASYFVKQSRYTGEETDITYENFDGDAARWNQGILIGNQQMIFEGRVPQGLHYHNLNTADTVSLCTIPDCEHNTDECQAQFAPDCSIMVLYCYDGKLYAGGDTTMGELRFYCSEMDGTNHEKIASLRIADDRYEEIHFEDFYVYDSCVYIAVSMADTDEMKVLPSGYMSDVPLNIQIYCFDMKEKEFTKLYQAPKDYYQACATIRYIYDGVLYYDFSAQTLPYEELYDETGELKDENIPDDGPSEVHALQLDTGEDTVVPEYRYEDYIGCEGDEYYFIDINEDMVLSGDIFRKNLQTGESKTIHIPDLEGKDDAVNEVKWLNHQFVVNECNWDEETGNIYFFDTEGQQTGKIEDTVYYIIGEDQDIYLLSDVHISTNAMAYIYKEDIDDWDKKIVLLEEEQ